jgi:glutamate-1-semialdehyde 2,1-aminomutase
MTRKYDKSKALYAEAVKNISGGVASNSRFWDRPVTLFVDKAYGSHIYDVDGNDFIDYRMAYGPAILGHSYPAVQDAVKNVMDDGVIYGFSHARESEVVEKVKKFCKHVDLFRYTCSGSESIMHAIRLARAYTGRDKIVKFEGQYHGIHNDVVFSMFPPVEEMGPVEDPIAVDHTAGVPQSYKDNVIVQPWNEFEILEKTVEREHDNIAAIITEPIMCDNGVIPPKDGYLQFLRDLCDKYGIVLIFDEVKAGFRIARGGAYELYGVAPDISAYAKAISNGYPLAGFGGKREIMELMAPGGPVPHGGTYNSNPIATAAAVATLDILAQDDLWDEFIARGQKLMDGIKEILNKESKYHFCMQGVPGVFWFAKTDKDRIYNYRELMTTVDFEYMDQLSYEMIDRGILKDMSTNEPSIMMSFSHTDEDIQKTLDALRDSIRAIEK